MNFVKKFLKINENLEIKKGFWYDGKMFWYFGIDYFIDVSFFVFFFVEKLGFKKFIDLVIFVRF